MTDSVPSKGQVSVGEPQTGTPLAHPVLIQRSEHQGQSWPDGDSCAGRSEGPRSWAWQEAASVQGTELSHHLWRRRTGWDRARPLGQAMLGTLGAWPQFPWAWGLSSDSPQGPPLSLG